MGSNGIKWDQMGHFSSCHTCHSFAKWPKRSRMETQESFETNQWTSEFMWNQWSQISQNPRQLPIPLRPHLKLPHLCCEIQAMQGSLLYCQCFSGTQNGSEFLEICINMYQLYSIIKKARYVSVWKKTTDLVSCFQILDMIQETYSRPNLRRSLNTNHQRRISLVTRSLV